MSKQLVVSVFGVLALTACEPIDAGGGGGVGGRLAFLRDDVLFISQDDSNGERTITTSDTSSADPALSPNGQTVAFAYSAAGSADARGIWRIGTADGSQLEEVARPGVGETFSSPTWSPDGATIVFVSTKGTESTLLQVDAGGGTPEAVAAGVTHVSFPAYLDANTLVVLQGTGRELKTLDLATGALTSLDIVTSSRAAVSRDGTRIAFAKESGGSSSIVVRTLATGADVTLATTGLRDIKPAFSPEGSFVAFEADENIYAAASDGTGQTELLQAGTDVSWGP